MADDAPLTIQISTNAKQVLAQIKAVPHAMTVAVARRLDLENQQTLRDITLKRMNFASNGPVQPNGLRRITSTAVRSLRATRATVLGELDISSAVGSNLLYLRAQELGFQGTVDVRAYTRRQFAHGTRSKDYLDPVTKTRSRIKVKTRRVTNQNVRVAAHTMQMNLVARHFFRDTLAERTPAYGAAISDEIVKAWDQASRNAGTAPAI